MKIQCRGFCGEFVTITEDACSFCPNCGNSLRQQYCFHMERHIQRSAEASRKLRNAEMNGMWVVLPLLLIGIWLGLFKSLSEPFATGSDLTMLGNLLIVAVLSFLWWAINSFSVRRVRRQYPDIFASQTWQP